MERTSRQSVPLLGTRLRPRVSVAGKLEITGGSEGTGCKTGGAEVLGAVDGEAIGADEGLAETVWEGAADGMSDG